MHGSWDDPVPSRMRERLCALWSTRECEPFLAERYEKDPSDGTEERVETARTQERVVEMSGNGGAVSSDGSSTVSFFFWTVISLIFYGIWEALGAGVLSVVRYVGGQVRVRGQVQEWLMPPGSNVSLLNYETLLFRRGLCCFRHHIHHRYSQGSLARMTIVLGFVRLHELQYSSLLC